MSSCVRTRSAMTWPAGLTGLALMSTVLGCSGVVSEADPDGDTPGDDNAGGDSDGGPSALVPDNCDEINAAPAQVGEAPLRRLTNEEYDNTIADLLGDTSRPAQAFPPESAIHGFKNKGFPIRVPGKMNNFIRSA